MSHAIGSLWTRLLAITEHFKQIKKRQGSKAAAIYQLIGHKVRTPDVIWACIVHRLSSGGANHLAPPDLHGAEGEALFLIQPIGDFLSHSNLQD